MAVQRLRSINPVEKERESRVMDTYTNSREGNWKRIEVLLCCISRLHWFCFPWSISYKNNRKAAYDRRWQMHPPAKWIWHKLVAAIVVLIDLAFIQTGFGKWIRCNTICIDKVHYSPVRDRSSVISFGIYFIVPRNRHLREWVGVVSAVIKYFLTGDYFQEILKLGTWIPANIIIAHCLVSSLGPSALHNNSFVVCLRD